ncbi:MAG: glycosyltransferase family 39 protein, partial [Nitrospiraceae bacterium]|nr:glycosyltransferase family 39 protein [Nitrospiraceae bacterium]
MRIIASVSFLAIVSALVCWFNFSLHFNGFILNDYHEYCQIARNFYEGNGYSTSVLRPIAYKFFTTLPQPEVTRVPLYPFSLSLFFHLFGPNDNAVVLFNSICYVALAILIFLIAFELSGEYIVGLLASLMTISMKSFIEYTITAEPNVFYAALIAAFFLFYLRHPEKTLIQGILLGILYLVRANSLFVF